MLQVLANTFSFLVLFCQKGLREKRPEGYFRPLGTHGHRVVGIAEDGGWTGCSGDKQTDHLPLLKAVHRSSSCPDLFILVSLLNTGSPSPVKALDKICPCRKLETEM